MYNNKYTMNLFEHFDNTDIEYTEEMDYGISISGKVKVPYSHDKRLISKGIFTILNPLYSDNLYYDILTSKEHINYVLFQREYNNRIGVSYITGYIIFDIPVNSSIITSGIDNMVVSTTDHKYIDSIQFILYPECRENSPRVYGFPIADPYRVLMNRIYQQSQSENYQQWFPEHLTQDPIIIYNVESSK